MASSPTTATGLVVAGMFVLAGGALAESRGELLYTTHCIACHSTQMHWRDKRIATDWNSLKEQVRLWQGRAQLAWSEADIADVTRYLNKSIYRFEEATEQASLDSGDMARGPSGGRPRVGGARRGVFEVVALARNAGRGAD